EWLDGSVFSAYLKKHQLRVIVELNRKPVPSRLIFCQLVSEKFVVHPGKPGDGILARVEGECARCGKPRFRGGVRSAAWPGRFLADSVFTVDHRRLRRT